MGNADNGLDAANQRTQLSANHAFLMNKLYHSDKQIKHLRKGKIEIFEDDQIQKPVYNIS